MTPREALYNIIVELGPMPRTNRDDNLSPEEIRLRDSIRVLQNFIRYHDDSNLKIPDSANEYIGNPSRLPRKGVEGKDRIETWKNEWKLK